MLVKKKTSKTFCMEGISKIVHMFESRSQYKLGKDYDNLPTFSNNAHSTL
jgi:hypothetical protein